MAQYSDTIFVVRKDVFYSFFLKSRFYVSAGEMLNALEQIRWPLDYFMRAHNPGEDFLFVQVGDTWSDHSYWGRPEDMTINRQSVKVDKNSPGSDVAAETAAAFAACSIHIV